MQSNLSILPRSDVLLQLREKAALAKSEAGGLAPLAHDVLEAQKEEQHRASELAALKRYIALCDVDHGSLCVPPSSVIWH